jgi:hypothetical protein
MELDVWDLNDPARLIEEIAERVPLLTNTAHLAVVEDPSTRQLLTHVETLPAPARIGHYLQVKDLLRKTMRERLPIPQWAGAETRHAVVTVIVRDGLTVFGCNEEQWLLAWRYSNHHMGAFTGTTFLVTEHGWYDWDSTWGDHEPRLLAQ